MYILSSSLVYAWPNSIKISQNHIQFIELLFSKCMGSCAQVCSMTQRIINQSSSVNNSDEVEKGLNILLLYLQSLLNLVDSMKKYYPHSLSMAALSRVELEMIIKGCVDLSLPASMLASPIFYRINLNNNNSNNNNNTWDNKIGILFSRIKYSTIKLLNKCSCILLPI